MSVKKSNIAPVGALAPKTTSELHNKKIGGKIAQMFNNSRLADVTVQLGEVNIPAHRLVLSLQSEYFDRTLSGAFAESSTGTLKCPPGKEHAYLRVLQYLYTGDYDDKSSGLIQFREDDPEILKDARVYFLADQFLLPDLKALSTEKLYAMPMTIPFMDCLVDSIAEIYTNTSRGHGDLLRMMVIKICCESIQIFLTRPPFMALLEGGGDFVIELIQRLAVTR